MTEATRTRQLDEARGGMPCRAAMPVRRGKSRTGVLQRGFTSNTSQTRRGLCAPAFPIPFGGGLAPWLIAADRRRCAVSATGARLRLFLGGIPFPGAARSGCSALSGFLRICARPVEIHSFSQIGQYVLQDVADLSHRHKPFLNSAVVGIKPDTPGGQKLAFLGQNETWAPNHE